MLENEMPALYEHIKQQQVPDELWLMKWFLSMFLYSLPPKHVIRIWDFIMSEGLLGIIKVSLGLLKVVEKDILLLDAVGMDLLFQYLKNGGNRITNISHVHNTPTPNQSDANNPENQANPEVNHDRSKVNNFNNASQVFITNQSNINHVTSQMYVQNMSNLSYTEVNQSQLNNHSINYPVTQRQTTNNNINLTQRDNIDSRPSLHNETSEIQYNIKELDIDEVLDHAEKVTLTIDKMLYFVDLYPQKTQTHLPEPYNQFFRNLHLYQTDINKLIEFQNEIDYHLMRSELSDKPPDEIIVSNLLDEAENTLILKDLVE